MKDTLVIVGSYPQTRGLFDFSRTDCDVWVFNEAMNQSWVKRADAVFQLHIPTIWRNPQNRNDPKHYEWLKSTNVPVFMQEKYGDVPASVEFPKDKILRDFPNAKQNGEPIREVACSPAWALAYAIYLGYPKIEIYGVELASNTEYAYQQGNFKYWLGVAVGKGIDVNIHSKMFNAPLYGYEGEVFLPYETFGDRIAELDTTKLAEKYGAAVKVMLTETERIMQGDNTDTILPLVQEAVNSAVALGEIDGAIQENERYKNKADEMIKTDEKFVFSRQEFEHGAAVRKKEVEQLVNVISAMKGQLEIYHNSALMAAKGSPKRRKLTEALKAKQIELIRAHNAFGILRGAMNENYRYMSRLDAGIKAAGGVKSEEAILQS
jgi:hypothetical protein